MGNNLENENLHACIEKMKGNNKMENVGTKWDFLQKTMIFRKMLIFYLRRQVTGCFGPGVEEQAGEVPLGERP